MIENFVGFYWTLPISWARFPQAGQSVDEAAEKSRTIRYQKERTRRWAKAEGAKLIKEVQWIDVDPEHATELITAVLPLPEYFRANNAKLAYIVFDTHNRWRRNRHTWDYAQRNGIGVVTLSPDPIVIDGVLFDPIGHFQSSREDHKIHKARLAKDAEIGVAAAMAAIPDGPNRYVAIAAHLNERDVRTGRGADWTAEAVRKYCSRRLPQP